MSLKKSSVEIGATLTQDGGSSLLQGTTFTIRDSLLRVQAGPHVGESFPLSQEMILVGRAEWCDVSLPENKKASKQHCELTLTPQGLRVRDLQSRNGTQIAGVSILEAYLQPGAPLQVGDCTISLELRDEEQVIEIPYYDPSKHLVGKSESMRALFSWLKRLARRELSVLLQGETGTGKTSIARALHAQSKRKGRAFVLVNCGALSPSLLEALFFGYEKGAFTGANKAHRGYFEQADGGTLFLDEIGELPLELQPKFLDVIERKRLRRLGGEREFSIDFRVVTATHRDLRKAIVEGHFREDLYYRIAVMELEVPPLRERLEDFQLLITSLLREIAPEEEIGITPAAIERCQGYLWPGNIRELRNILERSLLLAEEVNPGAAQAIQIDASHITLPAPYPQGHKAPQEMEPETTARVGVGSELALSPFKQQLEQRERGVLIAALTAGNWDVESVSESLEVSRSWLYKRMKRYQLQPPWNQ